MNSKNKNEIKEISTNLEKIYDRLKRLQNIAGDIIVTNDIYTNNLSAMIDEFLPDFYAEIQKLKTL